MTTITPPPLPEPALTHDRHGHMLPIGPCYTADQLRADRIAVAAAVLDACASHIAGYTEAGWAGLSAYEISDAIHALQIEESK